MDDEGSIMREALEFIANGGDEGVVGVTIAHLRIPRVEVMSYDSMDEYHNVVAKLIVDKTMAALVITTWPVHDH